jgi:YidC/Oxa1 family membrane protein insertase
MLVTANIFQPLIDVFESVLKFFHNSGGISWGWSIVLLTVAVRAVLIPLTFRQIKSMVRMQALAPQMKEIQAKYKDNKERQSQEMMKFYRENNVNPLGSCLPLVLQLPVFISLYYMLRQSLRSDICPGVQTAYNAAGHTGTTPCGAGHGASFLFIPDLTDKASGWVLAVLIVLYVGSQLGSTLVMSSAATMDPMQRRLMMFLPLVFVLFVFRFPAGVLVYWITTNFWTMGQQWVVRQRIGPRVAVAGAAPIDGTAGPPKSKGSGSRPGPGSGSATKALPKGDSANGNGDAAPASGGLSSFFRNRGQPAGAADVAANGKSNGEPSDETRTGSTSSAGKSSGSGSGSTKRSGSGSRSRASGKNSGSGKGSGSAKGSADESSSSAGAKPPPPPRKRKKRSGRRR